MLDLGGALRGQTGSFAETDLHNVSEDWAGVIDYQLVVRSTVLAGTVGIIFRWNDRNGTPRTHQALGLSLLSPGIVASNSFIVWSEYASPSPITVEVVVGGLILGGTPVYDVFINGSGNSYGA